MDCCRCCWDGSSEKDEAVVAMATMMDRRLRSMRMGQDGERSRSDIEVKEGVEMSADTLWRVGNVKKYGIDCLNNLMLRCEKYECVNV